MDMDELVFLKLGGSLITDKTQPYTPKLDKLARLADEIKSSLAAAPSLRLVLGHGSGSFGHYAVKEHLPQANRSPDGTGPPGRPESYWRGFAEVWYRASQLNRYVLEALHEAHVPAISIPPSALAGVEDGAITRWDLTSLKAALEAQVVPVIYGDIAFDTVRGGVVLSTEVLIAYLAHHLPAQRILLAGLEPAVWADFPKRREPVKKMTPTMHGAPIGKIGASHGTDVTGGMQSKVAAMLRLVREIPHLKVQIFSGEEDGNVEKALGGQPLGTLVASD